MHFEIGVGYPHWTSFFQTFDLVFEFVQQSEYPLVTFSVLAALSIPFRPPPSSLLSPSPFRTACLDVSLDPVCGTEAAWRREGGGETSAFGAGHIGYDRSHRPPLSSWSLAALPACILGTRCGASFRGLEARCDRSDNERFASS